MFPLLFFAVVVFGDSAYYQEWLRRFGLKPSPNVSVKAKSAALIVVDMQNDFVGEFSYTPEQISAGQSPCYTALGNSSGACFGVAEGSVVAQTLGQVLGHYNFATVIASMDDHSPNHCSFFASAGSTSAPARCSSNFDVAKCNTSAFHGCRGTLYEHGLHPGTQVYGPFPPHCVRGYVGTQFFSPIREALIKYTGDKHIGVKGLDLSTDSFGVFRYSEASWDFYNKANLLSTSDPRPAVLIRSMLTWEQNMNVSTGAASFTSPYQAQYSQPPPFSTTGQAGPLSKLHANDIINNRTDLIDSIVVTGLAGDWCVLDTALNAKATWPDKAVYLVLDALRPSFLPKAAAAMYLNKNPANQLYNGGVWLHDPADVASVLGAAGVQVITSAQLTST